MLSQFMSTLADILYPGEFTMEPGVFESFLSGVARLPEAELADAER